MARRVTRFFCILLVLCMVLSMMPAAVFAATPSTLYFKASTEWKSDGARFAAYFFGNGDTWASMTDADGDGYYECAVPTGGYTSVIFCRMNGSAAANNWDNKWNQTADLTIPTDGKNCFAVNAGEWDGAQGTWSTKSGGTTTTTLDYYLVGYINGANYGCEEDSANLGAYKFVDGKLTATFSSDSYVFIKTTGNSNWYMFDGFCEAQTGTLYNTAAGIAEPEKMFVPGNVEINFTLTKGSNDTLTLSYTTNSCKHNYEGVQTTAPKCNEAGVMTYTCSECGAGYTEPIPATGHTYVDGVCSVCGYAEADNLKIHFDNKLGWNGVVAYAWIANTETNLTSAWPGDILQKGENGLYTLELEYAPKSGESVGILFHDFYGNQTADYTLTYSSLSSGEVILQPGTTANAEGKYPLSKVADTVLSPVINGNKITFRYQGTTATSVALAGSMNNWSTTANKLTKSGSIWSITLELEPGIYEYKFVASSKWVTDPANGIVGGYDGNSIVVVPGAPAADQDLITIKFHYKRSDSSYTGWNVWYWGEGISGSSATFSTVSGDQGRVATFTVDGTKNTKVGFKIYKTNWTSIDMDYDRFIDLSDVKSGTVHYFINSGTDAGSRVLGEDAVQIGKPSYANYDYTAKKLFVKTTLPLVNPTASRFFIVDGAGNPTAIKVNAVELVFKDGKGYGYNLTLSTSMTLSQMGSYQVKYENYYCGIYVSTHDLFYSSEFAAEFTYTGNDLGANWSAASTTFKVWAPTAKGVAVKIFSSGDYGSGTELKYQQMTAGEKGVWSTTISGNWDGKYYVYVVDHGSYTVDVVDPYARSTGANGDRGMILNLDATDPEGWENDVSPNAGMNITDAIIYEMHIREMTLDSTSGVKSAWRGKFLGLTQDGTSYQGRSTGLAHLKELGVTHVQLMPVYDYAYLDEYYSNSYAWGYSPQNFNTPEGSYSTNPHDGKVRVNEYKQMIQTLHSNGINVVMDVVYNHAFDGGNFCYNKIVPNYFSRFYGEGNWSNGSGCGNDIATERTMARKFIVDSVRYWADEYHIDGFRFDLAGLIDVTTINEIIVEVHKTHPNVIFYGEGWAVGDTAVEYGNALATQWNSSQVPGFAFFSDSFREAVLPNSTSTWGFATGSGDVADAVARYMRASTDWCTSPTQIVNYTSCHDNYGLTDKIILTRDGLDWYSMAKMNRLAAATTLLSQGVSFIYSGDEMLREKKDGYGNRYHNAFDASDDVTKIRWSELVTKSNAQTTDDYYAGLIEFRKNHAALRTPNGGDAWNKTHYTKINNNCIMLYIEGGFNYECSSGIVILLNSSGSTVNVNLNGKIPSGTWNACIHGDKAGIESLWTVSGSGSVGVEAYSATVLVLGDLEHEQSVYNSQEYLKECSHSYTSKVTTAATCDKAGVKTYTCSKCGDSYTEAIAATGHSYTSVVTAPTCTEGGFTTNTCSACGDVTVTNRVGSMGHTWSDATCSTPQTCSVCGVTQGEHVDHGAYTYSLVNNVHTFTCPVCGNSFTKELTDGKQFKFNTASPALAVDIVMNIATTLPAGFTNPYMVIEFNGVTTTLTEYTVNAGNGRYEFAFPGINPQIMGDTFHATLYADVDGVEVCVSLDYSMVKYINSQLKKTTISDALRTALSDLVMYGEANQVYEGYKTDALLSTLLESTATLTPSTFPGLDESYNKQVTAGTKDANIDLKGVTMALGSKIMVRMTVFCADPSAYTVKVTINGEDFLYPVSELTLAAGYTDRYVVEFDQIRATQFGEEITFSFLDFAGNQVGRTLTYTVYTYVQKNQAADNENLVNLLKAIYNYGESVKKI